ncbi:MAG TPA: hypothetical protein VGL20_06960 [Candidatus Dormibacteraeota bacterium]
MTDGVRGAVARYGALVAAVHRAVVHSAGDTSAAARQAALSGEPAEGALGSYLDKVRRHAHRITDEDVGALRAAGLSEDAIFELTGAAAVGAAEVRLAAGLAALGMPSREAH